MSLCSSHQPVIAEVLACVVARVFEPLKPGARLHRRVFESLYDVSVHFTSSSSADLPREKNVGMCLEATSHLGGDELLDLCEQRYWRCCWWRCRCKRRRRQRGARVGLACGPALFALFPPLLPRSLLCFALRFLSFVAALFAATETIRSVFGARLRACSMREYQPFTALLRARRRERSGWLCRWFRSWFYSWFCSWFRNRLWFLCGWWQSLFVAHVLFLWCWCWRWFGFDRAFSRLHRVERGDDGPVLARRARVQLGDTSLAFCACEHAHGRGAPALERRWDLGQCRLSAAAVARTATMPCGVRAVLCNVRRIASQQTRGDLFVECGSADRSAVLAQIRARNLALDLRQLPATRRLQQLREGLGLDLAHALASDSQHDSDLVEREVVTVIDRESADGRGILAILLLARPALVRLVRADGSLQTKRRHSQRARLRHRIEIDLLDLGDRGLAAGHRAAVDRERPREMVPTGHPRTRACGVVIAPSLTQTLAPRTGTSERVDGHVDLDG